MSEKDGGRKPRLASHAPSTSSAVILAGSSKGTGARLRRSGSHGKPTSDVRRISRSSRTLCTSYPRGHPPPPPATRSTSSPSAPLASSFKGMDAKRKGTSPRMGRMRAPGAHVPLVLAPLRARPPPAPRALSHSAQRPWPRVELTNAELPGGMHERWKPLPQPQHTVIALPYRPFSGSPHSQHTWAGHTPRAHALSAAAHAGPYCSHADARQLGWKALQQRGLVHRIGGCSASPSRSTSPHSAHRCAPCAQSGQTQAPASPAASSVRRVASTRRVSRCAPARGVASSAVSDDEPPSRIDGGRLSPSAGAPVSRSTIGSSGGGGAAAPKRGQRVRTTSSGASGGAPTSASSGLTHSAWKERRQRPSQQTSSPTPSHTEQISSFRSRSCRHATSGTRERVTALHARATNALPASVAPRTSVPGLTRCNRPAVR